MTTVYENKTGLEVAEAATVSEAVGAAEAKGTNAPPVVDGTLSFSTDEDAAIVITEAELLANVSDPDGDALSILNVSASAGIAIDNGNGTWTFIPEENYDGTATLRFDVSDGTNTISTYARIEIEPINDAPILNAPVPGEDRPVNSYTFDHQAYPSIAGLEDGGWVVTWASNGQIDPKDWEIYVQRYDSEGRAVGGEVLVNTVTDDIQLEPTVTALSGGGFAIAWRSFGQDGYRRGVFSKVFDADGEPLTGDIQVNTTTMYDQDNPTIAGLVSGGYVVAWRSLDQDGDSSGIYAQTFNASGNPVGAETQVNTFTAGAQDQPSVTELADGGYVITWVSPEQDGDDAGVHGQRFDATGNRVGAEFQVNTEIDEAQENPAIASLGDGGFVVAWQSYMQDGSMYGVYLQRYDAEGAKVGGEQLINTRTQGNQLDPAVTGLANGGYVVTWESQFQDGSLRGVYAQIFDAAGAAQGSEFRVNNHTYIDQYQQTVTALADGGFVIAWNSQFQDGDRGGIFQRVFNADGSIRFDRPVFIENGAAVAVSPEIQLADIDSETIVGATVKIVDHVAGEDVLSFTGKAGISGTFDALTGTLTLSGTASVVDYQTVLRSITYENTSDNPSNGNAGLSREISFQVDDGGAVDNLSNETFATVEIVPVNDAPVVSGPVALVVTEVTGRVIKGSELLENASDPEGDSLSVLNLQTDSGTLVDNGDGTWTFTLAPDFKGTATLTYQVSDGDLVTDAQATISQPSGGGGGSIRPPFAGEGFSADPDVFHFSSEAGHQVVEAFAAGSGEENSADGIFDAIEVEKGSSEFSFADILGRAEQAGDDVVITFDEDTSLTLRDVDLTALTTDDFRFLA